MATAYDGLVFVGETNPRSSDPGHALYHLPRGASGDRLRRLLGLPDWAYAGIAKVNLCAGGRWDEAEARESVRTLVRTYWTIVTLGRRAARAVRGGAETPFFQASEGPNGSTVIALPHPSGLNRAWNEPAAQSKARALVRRYRPGIPWGA